MDIFNGTFLDNFTDWVGSFVHYHSYLAPLFLLLIEEAGIPLPIPGDIIVIYTGYHVAKGTIPYYIAFLILLISILVGSSILYFLSARYGQKIVLSYGHLLHLDEKKLLLLEEKFRKYGFLVIIFGRHIPGFRIPITVFSGMSGIGYKNFITCTFISVVFWIMINLSIGEHLGPKALQLLHTHQRFYLVGFIPLILTIIWWGYLIIKHKRFKAMQKTKAR